MNDLLAELERNRLPPSEETLDGDLSHLERAEEKINNSLDTFKNLFTDCVDRLKGSDGVARVSSCLNTLRNGYSLGREQSQSLNSLLSDFEDKVVDRLLEYGAIDESEWQGFKKQQLKEYEDEFPKPEDILASLDLSQNKNISEDDFKAQIEFAPDPLAEPELVAAFAESRKDYLANVWNQWQEKVKAYVVAQQLLEKNTLSDIESLSLPDLDPAENLEISQKDFVALFGKPDFSEIEPVTVQRLERVWEKKINALWKDWQKQVAVAREEKVAKDLTDKKAQEKQEQEAKEAAAKEQAEQDRAEKEENERKEREEEEKAEQAQKEIEDEKENPEIVETEVVEEVDVEVAETDEADSADAKKESKSLEPNIAVLIKQFKAQQKRRPDDDFENFEDYEQAFLKANPKMKAAYFDSKSLRDRLKSDWKDVRVVKKFEKEVAEQKIETQVQKKETTVAESFETLITKKGIEFADEAAYLKAFYEANPNAKRSKNLEAKLVAQAKFSTVDPTKIEVEPEQSVSETADLVSPKKEPENLEAAPTEFNEKKLNISEKHRAVGFKRWESMSRDSRMHLNMIIRNHPALEVFILETIALLPTDKFNRLQLQLRDVPVKNGSNAEVVNWFSVFCEAIGLSYLKGQNAGSLSQFNSYCQQRLRWKPVDQKETEQEDLLAIDPEPILTPEDEVALDEEAEIEAEEIIAIEEEVLIPETPIAIEIEDDEPLEIEAIEVVTFSEEVILPSDEALDPIDTDIPLEEDFEVDSLDTPASDMSDSLWGVEALADPEEGLLLEDEAEEATEEVDDMLEASDEMLEAPLEAELTEDESLEESMEVVVDEEVLADLILSLEEDDSQLEDNEADTAEETDAVETTVDEVTEPELLPIQEIASDEKPSPEILEYNYHRAQAENISLSLQISQIMRQLQQYAMLGDYDSLNALLTQLDGFLLQLVLQRLRLQGLLKPHPESLIEFFGKVYFTGQDEILLSQILLAVERYLFWVYKKEIKLPIPADNKSLSKSNACQLFEKIINHIERQQNLLRD